MKNLFVCLILFAVIFISGCDKEKPLLVLNSQPITKQTVNFPVQEFSIRQKINYVLIMPKGFTDSVIRIQIIKKNEKIAYWGYKIYQSQDLCVDMSKKFYINYFTIPEKGYYIMRAFEIKNLDEPVAIMDFWVK